MPDAGPRAEPPDGTVARTLDAGRSDVLLREEPLWIEVGGQRVLTMRTPGDDEHLAVGFLLTEGAIERAAAVRSTRWLPGDPAALRPDTVVVEVADGAVLGTGRLTRTHEIRSSCGLCGLADPDELLEGLPPLLPGVPRLETAALEGLRRRFQGLQGLFAATGAAHAAVLFDRSGTVLGQGEDVGRHNALDKAVGDAATAGHDLAQSIAMLSGRAGFDLVYKCLRVRIPIILSVSAPSALSFDVCKAAGATLVGFVREGRHQVYCAGSRLVAGDPG